MIKAPRYDVSFKIIMLGDSGVGKTSLLRTYVDQEFKEDLESTMGIEFSPKIVEIMDKKVQLEIWDTAGQERFHAIASNYYRRAAAILLVYDITCKHSFERVKFWLDEFETSGNPNALVTIVGNKVDLEDKREVNLNDAIALTQKNKLKGYDVTAKEVNAVNTVFTKMAKRLLKRHNQLANKNEIKSSIDAHPTLRQTNKKQSSSSCCKGE